MSRPGTADGARTLPCGRSVADLVELVADGALLAADPARELTGGADPGAGSRESERDGLAPHARTCPHCSAELVVLRTRWEVVRRAAASRIDTPVGLVDRVQNSIRGLRGGLLAGAIELAEPGGRLSVAEPVLVVLARQLVREHAAARGGLWERGVELAEGRLRARIAVEYGVDIVAAADELRQRLGVGLAEHIGVAVPPIEVEVVDVVAPHPFG